MLVPFITEIKRRIERRRELKSEGHEKKHSGRMILAVAIIVASAVAGYVSALNSMPDSNEPVPAVVPVDFDTKSGAHFRNVKMISGNAPSSETIRMLLNDGCAVVSNDTSYLNGFLSRYDYEVVATAEESGEPIAFWCDTSSDGLRAAVKQNALKDEYDTLLRKIDEKVKGKTATIFEAMQKKFEAWRMDHLDVTLGDIFPWLFGGENESARARFLKEFESTQDLSSCTNNLAFRFASEQFVNGKLIRPERGSATQFSEICQTKLNADVDKQRSPLTAAFIRVKNAEAVLAE